jgi:hypothetical protein
MYISAVAGNVILYLQHEFYNMIFKIKHKLHTASGSPPPPPKEKFWVCTWYHYITPKLTTLKTALLVHLPALTNGLKQIHLH